MAIEFARRMDGMKASDIREILKLTARPSVISFAGGLPAPELFPVEEIAAVAAEVLEEKGRQALQYSTTEGHLALRERIATRMNERSGTTVRPDQVLITSGSQQGLDLTGKILVDDGDEVFVESPTYLGALQALATFRPRYVEVATDDEGMMPDELDRALTAALRPKLVYVIPDFQNPTGRTWSMARRRSFMEVVRSHRIPVVEDNPYGELRFEGEFLPPLKSMDDHGLVTYLGTFSKIFCPGLRIGWLAANSPFYEKYVLVKQGADLHTSTLSQWQLAAYLERYDIDANIARIRKVYRRRRDVMLDAIGRFFPKGVRTTRPQGGLFLWAELPEQVNARDLLVRCLEHDVAFVPGGSFYPNGGHKNTMRLNYSNMGEESIVEGIRRLSEVLHRMLDECDEPRPAPAVRPGTLEAR